MNVRITHLDGSLPNLALMRLSAWHKKLGHTVFFTQESTRTIFEPQKYDAVYGSSIFKFSQKKTAMFLRSFPNALLGGTGTEGSATIEDITGTVDLRPDYDVYPEFNHSLGFTQRGCRFKCKFCVVPKKEGENQGVSSIIDIYRGEPYPRNILLLDNDFFGQEEWQKRISEIRDGKFKVCFSQGINVRTISEGEAEALASIEYRDTKFERKRIYTAWDNLEDEEVFFRGIAHLEKSGISPKQVMAYMLVGFSPRETWERIWHRFFRMVDVGIQPYPMVFDRSREDLLCFQRWVVGRYYQFIPWDKYDKSTKSQESLDAYNSVFSSSKKNN